jgi:hypothetical protein
MIFNEQHNEIRRTVRKFVEGEINPNAGSDETMLAVLSKIMGIHP